MRRALEVAACAKPDRTTADFTDRGWPGDQVRRLPVLARATCYEHRVTNERERFYQAMRTRDRRFDGRFFVGVKTTGIYCRPICPAPPPKLENVTFYACAAGAEAAGFRPCLRCRPETAPGTPAWQGSVALVGRALRLIRDGALAEEQVDALAERLGVGPRQLRRLFAKHLGASPLAVARAQRLHFARVLLDETQAPVSEVAYAAGFRSVRQFNHAVREVFRDSPTGLRRRTRRRGDAAACRPGEAVEMRLAYRPPYDWDALIRFLAMRAIPAVEHAEPRLYRRTIEAGERAGYIEVEPAAGEPVLRLRVYAVDCADLLRLSERVRRLFDLDADPQLVGAGLARSTPLAPLVAAAPGLRVPGAWDAFELAVRAVLGQQVTVAGATTLAGRLVQRWGREVDLAPQLSRIFPRPEVLAQADIAAIGLPRARGETIRALAVASARGDLVLDAARGLDDAVARLRAVPGLGDWTAHYIAMRAFNEADAFPASDLGIRRALGNGSGPMPVREVERVAEEWRPWRAYATMHLWNGEAQRQESEERICASK